MPADPRPPLERPGLLTAAAESLARMIRASATWQQLTADTAHLHDETAESGIYLRSIAQDTPLPWCSIQAADEVNWSLAAGGGGAQNFLRASGTLLLVINSAIPAELVDDVIRREMWALDAHSGVLADVAALAGHDDLLAITEIRLLAYGPPNEQVVVSHGLDFESVWTIRWGDA